MTKDEAAGRVRRRIEDILSRLGRVYVSWTRGLGKLAPISKPARYVEGIRIRVVQQVGKKSSFVIERDRRDEM